MKVISGILGIVLFSSTFSKASESWIVTPMSSGGHSSLHRLLEHPSVVASEPLFSKPDRIALTAMGSLQLADVYLIQVEGKKAAQALKRWRDEENLPLEIEKNEIEVLLPEEPLEGYQWGLHNSGKGYPYEISDLVSMELPAQQGEDIQISRLPIGTAKSKIRVAVLDTGVDDKHPNLRDRIVRDPAECEALSQYKECIKKNPQSECDSKWIEVDANHNGYPLDCSGWNFTAGVHPKTNIYGNNDPSDDIGHGTHIAGIIAAALNGTGIRGVAENVEILPVKVIRSAPNAPVRPQAVGSGQEGDLPPPHESQLRWSTEFANIIARGMLYAIRSNAQVINLSLGWPIAADTQFMRKMVALAQSRGILVVAAAGNDSSDSRVMPCQYEGVICVGSYNPDGTLSHFSNYGSFVDIAAPGMQILSTWPLKKRSYYFTERAGFEYKNGTSMATPFVVGALAHLMSNGFSSQEALVRLLAGARPTPDSGTKYLRSGNLDLARAYELTPQGVILPVDKKTIIIPWDRVNKQLPIQFSLKNFWTSAKNVHLSARITTIYRAKYSDTAHAEMAHLKFNDWMISDWPADGVLSFDSVIAIDDVGIDGRLLLELDIEGPGLAKRTLKIPVEISVIVHPDSTLPGVRPFAIVGGPISDDAEIRTVTSLIPASVGSEIQDYISIEETESRRKLQWIEQRGTEYHLGPPSPEIEITQGEDLVAVQQIDYLLNGKKNLVLIFRTPAPVGVNRTGLKIVYLDETLSVKSIQSYDNKTSGMSERFGWLKIQERDPEGLKERLVPAWVGLGATPELDKPEFDGWTKFVDTLELRMYYLGSDGLHYIKVPKGYSLAQMFVQNLSETSQGLIKLFLSEDQAQTKGRINYFQAQAVSHDGEKTIEDFRPLSFEKFRTLEGLDTVMEVTPLDPQTQVFGSAYSGPSSRGSQRTTLFFSRLNHPHVLYVTDRKQNSISHFDSVIKVSGSFIGENSQAIFTQTRYSLSFYDLLNKQTAVTDLDRFSFLPTFVFSKTFFPVAVSSREPGRDRLPGMLIPAAMGISNSVEVVVPQYSEIKIMPSTSAPEKNLLGLSHPARLRLAPGLGCIPMGNYIKANSQFPSQVVFFCRDKFIRVPLSLHE